MHLCLFEDEVVPHLYPLVLTRPVYDLRIGRRTLAERLMDAFQLQTILHCRREVAGFAGQEYDRLVNHIPGEIDVLFVNGRWFVEEGDVLEVMRQAVRHRDEPRTFVQDDDVIAAWVPRARADLLDAEQLTAESFDTRASEKVEGARMISRLWHPLDCLEDALLTDYDTATHGYKIYERPGAILSDGVVLAEPERIYVAPGGRIKPGAILNAEQGPIHMDSEAIVMEGAVVRGPCYIGPGAQIKVGANVEAACFGAFCKVSGEVHQTIMHSYSNKAHSGHLGHAYLGRWCNIGAGTENSNLKNDYGIVTLYSPVLEDFEETNRQFLGLIMGDHSKCGINSMFNTGTVIGVFCNLYGTGFPPRYIPSFAWGSPEGFQEYRLDKALRVAQAVMARRDVPLTETDRELLSAVFERTRAERTAMISGS